MRSRKVRLALVVALAALGAGGFAAAKMRCSNPAGTQQVAQNCTTGYCCGQWGCWTTCRCW